MLILASKSPRREELIARLGVRYAICPGNADETLDTPLPPDDTVKVLSKRKAEAVLIDHPDDLILGADTIVYCDGQILGKPATPEIAEQMLHLLSGKTHIVYSGFTLLTKNKCYSEAVPTKVTFAPLSKAEITRYIESADPFDKAGAYGIQGQAGLFVEKINGDYNAVVGLPLSAVYAALKREFEVDFDG